MPWWPPIAPIMLIFVTSPFILISIPVQVHTKSCLTTTYNILLETRPLLLLPISAHSNRPLCLPHSPYPHPFEFPSWTLKLREWHQNRPNPEPESYSRCFSPILPPNTCQNETLKSEHVTVLLKIQCSLLFIGFNLSWQSIQDSAFFDPSYNQSPFTSNSVLSTMMTFVQSSVCYFCSQLCPLASLSSLHHLSCILTNASWSFRSLFTISLFLGTSLHAPTFPLSQTGQLSCYPLYMAPL